MASYTTEEAERVFAQDRDSLHEHYARLAAEQYPAVRRAIAHLTGTTPPAGADAELEPALDSDEADAELDGDGQHPGDED